jgi:ABC-type phosphate/phosphonate transport system substrate-binding protein
VLVLLALLSQLASAATPTETYKVGFISRDGEASAKSEFQPTITALNAEFKSRSRKQRLSLDRLSFDEVLPEIQSKQVDFLIVDPDLYVLTEELGAHPIATLRRKYEGQEHSSYGGVIFGVDGSCKVDPATNRLAGKVAAVRPTSRDGYGLQQEELERRGIAWDQQGATLVGGHSEVVDLVVKKSADCGFVRTGTLEQFAKNWKFKLSRIQGLFLDGQAQKSHYITSTSASNEWPFVALAHVDPATVELVSFALSIMKPYPNPRFKDETLRWSYPVSYKPARDRRYLASLQGLPEPEPEPEPELPPEPEPEVLPEPEPEVAEAADEEPPVPEEAATPRPVGGPARDPRMTLAAVIGIVLGLIAVIGWAAYAAGRSAGFSRALADDWSPPTPRELDRVPPEPNDF